MSNPSYGVPGEQGTPWPQYGQNGPGAPQGYPGGVPGPGYPGPAVMPTGKLPSRAPGGILIGLGVLMMVVVAPIVFVVLLSTGFRTLGEAAAQAATIDNGDTVTVSSSGSYTVMVSPGTADSCALIDSGQQSHQMSPFDNEKNVYSIDGLAAGDYVVRCDGLDSGANLMGVNMSGADLMASTGSAMIWSTVIGVSGIVVLIVGIVLLVRANGKRRAIRQQAMMSAIG